MNTASTPTFTRYCAPYVPPIDRAEWPAAFQPMADALARHDEDAVWRLFLALYENTDAPASLPYSLWTGAWTLLAQGPASSPADTLAPRLAVLCARLGRMEAWHRTSFPTVRMPRMFVQRYFYLLLKHAERLERDFTPAEAEHAAEQLTTAIGAPAVLDALDTPLLGRLIFRLARLGVVAPLDRLLTIYTQRPDLHAEGRSAAQPFAAVVAGCAGEARTPDSTLALGVEALRLAFLQGLPVKGSVVQTLLLRLGTELLALLLHPTHETAPAPNAVQLQTPWTVRMRQLSQSRPAYLEQRAAVVLCRANDPRAALRLIRTSADLPYDVYAAAISALSWWARERKPGYDAAMALAVQTLHRLHRHDSLDYEPDQQMYGEMIRGMQAALRHAPSGLPTPAQEEMAAALGSLVTTQPTYAELLCALTEPLLRRMPSPGMPLLRWAHHTRLLAMHVQHGQYGCARALYEHARHAFPARLPCTTRPGAPPRTLLSLFAQATRRPTQLAFAVRMYHDLMAHGVAIPLRTAAGFLHALLAGGMPTVAQQTVRDLWASKGIPRSELAPAMLRAFFSANLVEPGVALARMMYEEEHAAPAWEVADPLAHAPLAMYALCLHEASHTKLAYDPEARDTLLRLLDEFRLALAHALAQQDADEGPLLHIASQAYHGAVRLLLPAVAHDASDAARRAAQASIDELVAELRELLGDPCALSTLPAQPKPEPRGALEATPLLYATL